MGRKTKAVICLFSILVLLGGILLYEETKITTYTYEYEEAGGLIYNPLIGFAPNADYTEAVGENTLVYVDVTWRELEPEEGQYDFETIEEENQLHYWKTQGKKIVFRFMSDVPGEDAHMDIPDWLYKLTADGVFYDTSYGKGYSPNYANETLISYHEKAIEALGEQFGTDSFFAYVEIGSVGHWGEWHIKDEEGMNQIPDEQTCERYVTPYLAAFPNAKLLMRRPFSFVTKYGMGVYNDVTGEEDETLEWLSWIENGGSYEEAASALNLPAYPDLFKEYPVGGELTSTYSMYELLVERSSMTLELIAASHMSFLGPKCPITNEEQQLYPEETASIHRQLGYRYTVSKASFTYHKTSKTVTTEFEIKNIGSAPIYFEWPLYLYLLDEDGRVKEKVQCDLMLTTLNPGESATVKTDIISKEFSYGTLSIGIGIEDVDTNKPAVNFDLDVYQNDNIFYLYKAKS